MSVLAQFYKLGKTAAEDDQKSFIQIHEESYSTKEICSLRLRINPSLWDAPSFSYVYIEETSDESSLLRAASDL